VNEKVRRLATIAIDAEQCERLVTTVRNLEAMRDVSGIGSLLTR
jgi:hypothetical protein